MVHLTQDGLQGTHRAVLYVC